MAAFIFYKIYSKKAQEYQAQQNTKKTNNQEIRSENKEEIKLEPKIDISPIIEEEKL